MFAENLFASCAASGAESCWKFAGKIVELTGVKKQLPIMYPCQKYVLLFERAA